MVVLGYKDIQKNNKEEIKTKLKDLRMELLKNKMQKAQGSAMKTKEIKKAIARILTYQNTQK